VAERQLVIVQRLREVNAGAEAEALEAHFAKRTVKVAPYDPASPAIEPRCFYAHTFLEWGRLKTHRYWESTRLRGAAIKYLWERPSGGVMTLADVERLAD
jgi:hypothetical protein